MLTIVEWIGGFFLFFILAFIFPFIATARFTGVLLLLRPFILFFIAAIMIRLLFRGAFSIYHMFYSQKNTSFKIQVPSVPK